MYVHVCLHVCLPVCLHVCLQGSLQRGPCRKYKEYYCFCTGDAGNTMETILFRSHILYAFRTRKHTVSAQAMQEIQRKPSVFSISWKRRRQRSVDVFGTSVQGSNLYNIMIKRKGFGPPGRFCGSGARKMQKNFESRATKRERA